MSAAEKAKLPADVAASVTPEFAFAELRGALEAAGIKLPSLGLDPDPYENRVTLVELGPCNAATAFQLAEVIRRGAKA